MRRFFLLICLVIAGAVSDSKRVKVKCGENITLHVETLGNVRRVSLQNCENRTGDPIIRYCSPEEEKSGCTAKESERFSIRCDTGSLSVTFVDARVSDEGCYAVSYIDVANIFKKKLFNVTVHGSLETAEDKGKETPWTISLQLLNIIVCVSAVIFISSLFLLIIYCNCKKKQQNRAPAETIPLSSATSGASKPATDESFEVMDETKCSVANINQRSKKDLNHGA
ncbi:hypothetical protein QQF64_020381 [Cirrhinus molitorella]|uniref:Immunoglobulin V-set domain-containing protein n=1 Tax=Cirrhinus molitorella TaxID=172907 RepID=A0ABR3LBC6_9TELE